MLTVPEVAKKLGLKEGTVRSYMWNRKLGYVKFGTRAVRIPVEEVERLIRAHTIPARTRSGSG